MPLECYSKLAHWSYGRSWDSKTYHRGSTLTGFTFSSLFIVVSYHWGAIG